MLLFNSIYGIGEAFVEDSCHTYKHVPNFLRHSRTERCFKLRFHISDDRFCVPLAILIESHECVLEFQDFSDNDLHFIFGLVALALNNVVFTENLDDCIMHYNNSLCHRFFCFGNFELASILELCHHFNLILVYLQEGEVRLDKGPSELLRSGG